MEHIFKKETCYLYQCLKLVLVLQTYVRVKVRATQTKDCRISN